MEDLQELHSIAAVVFNTYGWFCEQSGFFTRWTGLGGRHWSGTQTRSVVADQGGQKRDSNHQIKEERYVMGERNTKKFYFESEIDLNFEK